MAPLAGSGGERCWSPRPLASSWHLELQTEGGRAIRNNTCRPRLAITQVQRCKSLRGIFRQTKGKNARRGEKRAAGSPSTSPLAPTMLLARCPREEARALRVAAAARRASAERSKKAAAAHGSPGFAEVDENSAGTRANVKRMRIERAWAAFFYGSFDPDPVPPQTAVRALVARRAISGLVNAVRSM